MSNFCVESLDLYLLTILFSELTRTRNKITHTLYGKLAEQIVGKLIRFRNHRS